MCNPHRWLWGLLPLALLALLAIWRNEGPVGQDVATRANAELAAQGLGWARVEIAGRDARLVGQAPNEESRALAAAAADRVWGLRRVEDGAGLIPETRPYAWTAARADNTITLTGVVPNQQARQDIVAQARQAFAGAQVVDQMTFARTAPEGFSAAAAQGLREIGRLPDGRAVISDRTLTVTGTAPTADAFAAVGQGLATAPAGFTIANQVVAPAISPYVMTAVREGAGMILRGHVPDEAARAATLAAARAAAPNLTVTDQLQIGRGAPAGFAAMAAFAAAQAGRLDPGSAQVSGTALTIAGRAATFDIFDGVAAALGQLPAGLSLARQDIVPPTASPYVMGLTRTPQGIVIEGLAPSAEARTAILNAARAALPAIPLTDRIRIASGVPQGMDWVAASSFAITQTARLRQGTVRIENQSFAIDGDAADRPGWSTANQDVRAPQLPGGLRLASANIRPPAISPYAWTAERTGAAVVLEGYVPSDEVKAANVAAARAAFPGATVADRQELAAGAPARFPEAAVFALQRLAALDPGRAAISDATLRVAGRAPTEAAAAAARTAVQGSQGLGYTPIHEITAPPPPAPPRASPYVWTVERAADGVTLRGPVPNEQARAATLAAARAAFPNVTVRDQQTIAVGEPTGFLDAARLLIGQAARLETGAGTISDATLRLVGRAESEARAGEVRQAVTGGTAGFARAHDIMAPPPPPPVVTGPPAVSPFAWVVERTADRVVLRGVVPSDQVKTANVEAARRAFAPTPVVDEQTLASGAPPAFPAATAFAIAEVARLQTGVGTISDATMRIAGRAESEARAASIRAAVQFSGTPGFTRTHEITAPAPAPAAPPPDPCPPLIRQVLETGVVTFRTARAELSPVGVQTLERIVPILRQCPATSFVVEGHTDADGNPAFNQDLSQRRAQAVVDFFVSRGVPAGRLTPQGFGQTRPVAPNDTAEGKARNRRIELEVRR